MKQKLPNDEANVKAKIDIVDNRLIAGSVAGHRQVAVVASGQRWRQKTTVLECRRCLLLFYLLEKATQGACAV